MARQGLCSRREADDWISRGWVRVDGGVMDQLGSKIDPGQVITLDPRAQQQQDERVTILLNKPVGYVSNLPEKGHPPAVSLITRQARWAQDPSRLKFNPFHLHYLAPAGRLDIDSQGLLVFTQDGRLARRLIGEDTRIEKEYAVRVEGGVTAEALRKLRHGLSLDGRPLKPATVLNRGRNELTFILQEGRKRQIRRMCEQVGLRVVFLQRLRIGRVHLGGLPPGRWRYLGAGEAF